MVFTKLLLENALAIRPCNYEAALGRIRFETFQEEE